MIAKEARLRKQWTSERWVSPRAMEIHSSQSFSFTFDWSIVSLFIILNTALRCKVCYMNMNPYLLPPGLVSSRLYQQKAITPVRFTKALYRVASTRNRKVKSPSLLQKRASLCIPCSLWTNQPLDRTPDCFARLIYHQTFLRLKNEWISILLQDYYMYLSFAH